MDVDRVEKEGLREVTDGDLEDEEVGVGQDGAAVEEGVRFINDLLGE